MKKPIDLILTFICICALVGCGSNPAEQLEVIDGNIKSYARMSDGTWQADGNSYEYRLEISGKMPNSNVDTTFVYLSNLKNISFEQAWKAAGLSSNTDDYFDSAEAVLVDLKTE